MVLTRKDCVLHLTKFLFESEKLLHARRKRWQISELLNLTQSPLNTITKQKLSCEAKTCAAASCRKAYSCKTLSLTAGSIHVLASWRPLCITHKDIIFVYQMDSTYRFTTINLVIIWTYGPWNIWIKFVSFTLTEKIA